MTDFLHQQCKQGAAAMSARYLNSFMYATMSC